LLRQAKGLVFDHAEREVGLTQYAPLGDALAAVVEAEVELAQVGSAISIAYNCHRVEINIALKAAEVVAFLTVVQPEDRGALGSDTSGHSVDDCAVEVDVAAQTALNRALGAVSKVEHRRALVRHTYLTSVAVNEVKVSLAGEALILGALLAVQIAVDGVALIGDALVGAIDWFQVEVRQTDKALLSRALKAVADVEVGVAVDLGGAYHTPRDIFTVEVNIAGKTA
jgi:hypothetical protein